MNSYALIFQGHDFEYEVQAIAKIFIPGVRFELCRGNQTPQAENRILSRFDEKNQKFDVEIHLNGKFYFQSVECSPDGEYQLCKLLYDGLQTMTSYQPPWGMLTGDSSGQKSTG